MVSHISASTAVSLVLAILISGLRFSVCTNFTIVNNCNETIWPGIAARDNNYTGDGFTLKPGQSTVFTAPSGWGGRIWARTSCNFDKNGTGKCQTGGCNSSFKCTGPGEPPSSIGEFNLGELDYYDVSLVDGFNLPMTVTPVNGKGNCSVAGCGNDLRDNCPAELALKNDGKVVACKSACNVFNTDEYCCRGVYSDLVSCVATNYSRIFKQACPAAYSFAHDDPTSVRTCTTTDYVVSFCSGRNHTKCTYHDKELVCSGSDGLMSFSQSWWMLAPTILTTLYCYHLYAHASFIFFDV